MPDIFIRSLDGAMFGGYIATPKIDNAPGLIVIHEIFGVNDAMRQICDSYAELGFLAICPDLYWRQEQGACLSDKSETDRTRAYSLYKNFDVEASLRDLLATLAHLRQMCSCNGRVASVGYCLGGKLSWLLAARSDIDCSSIYYGIGLEGVLDEIYDVRMPVLLHFAENDKLVLPSAQEKVLTALPRNNVISAFTYPGVEHAFACPDGQSFSPEAAALANKRTAEFLEEHLKR